MQRLITALTTVLLTSVWATAAPLELKEDSRIVLIGGGLGSRMMQYGSFEANLHHQHPDKKLFIRNMCDEGNTPGFRPHSSRPNPWAFPGAEKFHPPLSDKKIGWGSGNTGIGSMPSPDEWLTQLKPDIIIAFFGFNRAFDGPDGVENFEGELRAFIQHTQAQKYNGVSASQLALVSPAAFENPSTDAERATDTNLALYAAAMKKVAAEANIPFVDGYAITQQAFAKSKSPLTRDGVLLNRSGYQHFQETLVQNLFGNTSPEAKGYDAILAAVNEKNWVWEKYFKIPNGVHVYGRRHKPFGPANYPAELTKLEEMCAIRDQAVWATAQGKTFDLAAADAKTTQLPEIKTNYKPGKRNGTTEYLYGKDALASFTIAPGYKIEAFATEKEFPNLANPVQVAFDNKGRLWVAAMPSYPHWKPGDPRPDDKLLIYEDTNNDGKADKEIVFADKLHLPTGFEISHDGVYVAQGNHLIRLIDTDGDDHADVREIVMSGFDDHDTHHVISAFCADPSGAIYMGEGVFLHTHVETADGPRRSANGGFFRFSPQRNELERTASLAIPNPWGTAINAYGQPFFLDTSGPDLNWLTPGAVQVNYGQFTPKAPSLLERNHRVRPTSGLEFVSSDHFPEDVQGDIMLNNTIGFLGIKQHQMLKSDAGFKTKHRHDLITSSDGNFRPVDLEFAPDGSLYLCDWHNVLIGHMQHSARDPLRDHQHGRIYRITYPDRPLATPRKIHGASIADLLDNLHSGDDRTRYRTRRELRSRPADDVLAAIPAWLKSLSKSPQYEHSLLEALWVTWGLDAVDSDLLQQALDAKDARVRAAAIEVLRCNQDQIEGAASLLMTAASDGDISVRLQAAVAASWMPADLGLPVLNKIAEQPKDLWIEPALKTATAHLEGKELDEDPGEKMPKPTAPLKGKALELYKKGHEVYSREGHCATCHQPDGEGLAAAMFPPLSQTKWVNGPEERLIKLTLHGLHGPIEVKGKKYPGQVPMMAFKQLSDDEIAAVLTYVRNTFGNKAPMVTPDKVKEVREATKSKQGFYSPADLLKEHPHK